MDSPNQSLLTLPLPATKTPVEQSTVGYGKKNWKKWAWIYLLIGLLIYAAIYYFVLSKQGTKPYSTNYSTPTPQPTIVAQPTTTQEQTIDTSNWETYTSKKVGYSIKAPADWNVELNENDSELSYMRDYLVNMILSPQSLGGVHGDTVTITFPINTKPPFKEPLGKYFENGLAGFEKEFKAQPLEDVEKISSNYSTLANHRTLVTYMVSKPFKPILKDQTCNCTQNHYYVELNDGSIIDIWGHWDNGNTKFESIFKQILSTFTFD